MNRTPRFVGTGNQRPLVDKLNRAFEQPPNIIGGDCINVSHIAGSGTVVDIDLHSLLPRIPKAGSEIGNTVIVKITGNASGGGKYNGRILTGESTAVATGNLTMPEGMTVPASDDAYVLNLAENGLSTHLLATNSYFHGTVTGTSGDGRTIVEIDSDSVGSGTQKYQVLQMTSTTTRGWDWVRAHS